MSLYHMSFHLYINISMHFLFSSDYVIFLKHLTLRKKSQILNMVYNSGSQTIACIRILGGFVKMLLGWTLNFSFSQSLEWSPGVCIFNKFPSDDKAVL